MAQGVIGTKVKLDGEKEYRQAISKLNENLKTLASEMKLASEAYAENADGIDGLAAKGEILQKQISAQQEKVKALDEIVRKSADAYGETDTRTQKYQQSLNYARADLVKMQRALEDNTDRLGKAEGAASDFGKELDAMDEQVKAAADRLKEIDETSASWGECLQSLGAKLGIKLPDSARASLDKLGKLDKSFLAVAAGAGAAVAAIVKIEKQLISLTTQSAETMEKLSNAASSGGMSIQSAQEWDHVLRSVGSSLESASGDLAQLQVKITEAAQGTGEAKEIFDKLRISVTNSNGALKSTDQLLPELVEKFQRMGDTTERNAIANKLLGGTGTALIPILNQTGDELQALIEEKRHMGVLSEKEVADLTRTAEAQRKYTEAIEASKDRIAGEYAPVVADLYSASADAITSVSKMLKKSGILEYGKDILEFITDIMDNLGKAAEKSDAFFSRMRQNIKGFQGPMESLAVFADTLGVIGGLLSLDFDKVKTHLGFNERNGKQSYLQKWWSGDAASTNVWDENLGTWVGNGISANAAGIDHWPGGMTWVGENGPERVWLPEGTRIQTAQESRAGGDTFRITIPARDIKEFNDIVRIAKNARRAERMGTT